MKRNPDNQINASFIDILRNKWLVLLLQSSFFRTTRPLASSEAMAYYRPAPGRTDSIPERDQRPRDKFFAGGTSKAQVLDKGIRQKSTKKSELIHCLQCLLSRATQLWPQGFRETVACIQVNCHDGTPRVACLQVFRQNTQKSECVYRRSPIGRPNKNVWVYTASDANWLTSFHIFYPICEASLSHHTLCMGNLVWFQ